jgi:hypothetical protein
MIKSVAKLSANFFRPSRATLIQPALMPALQSAHTFQLSEKITFGLSTKDDKGKK